MESKTIGVIGLGLMGASLCKALGARGHRILGKDTDEHVQKYALLTETIREELTEGNIPECDYLFLAVYPGAAVESLKKLAPLIRKDAVVCDLCGVNRRCANPALRWRRNTASPLSAGIRWLESSFRASNTPTGTCFRTRR